jgi:hypothetical protein
MRKAGATSHIAEARDELRKEYRFDYTKGKPNRFAGQPAEARVVVVLDPDVAEVFETPDSVNEVLRALIKTMPKRRRTGPKSKRTRTTTTA